MAIAILFLLVGCQSARVARPLTAELGGSDPQTQLNFWHTLAERPVTSNDEAFHGLILFVEGHDPAGSYADRVALLKGRRMLAGGFNAPAEQAVTRGDLAVAICRALEIKGGAVLRIVGGQSQRYAVRELVFQDIYPPSSSPWQTFSGIEYLGIIAKMEDHQRGNLARVPPTLLPGEVAQVTPTTRPASDVPAGATTQPAALAVLSAYWAAVAEAADRSIQPGTQPATAPANLQATITGVEGIVQVRLDEDRPWQMARNGMVLGVGAEFRTGPKSAVRFTIPPDQTITLDRMGTVKVLEAMKNGLAVKTDLGMKYGRVRYEIEAAGVSHDSSIHSPGATLAVQGTIVALTNQPPFVPTASSITGRARFKDLGGQTTAFGGPDEFAAIESGSLSPAFSALGETYVDPVSPFGRTESEERFALNNPVIGSFTPSSGLSEQVLPRETFIPVTPTTPPIDTQRGSLVFFLAWNASQTTAAAANLDLYVTSPVGEILSPTGPRTVPSGGQAPSRAPTGSSYGQQSATWPTSYPLGTYTYSVRYVSGAPAEYGLAVFRDGQLVATPNVGSISKDNPADTFTVNVATSSGVTVTSAPAAASRHLTRLTMVAKPAKPQPVGPQPVASQSVTNKRKGR